MVKKIASMDLIANLLKNTLLSQEQQDKIMEYAAMSEFGPERHRTAMADVLRNLSTPEQSPFGASGLLRMSDPNLEQKMNQQFTGQPSKASVKVSHGQKLSQGLNSTVNKIAQERRERLRNR
jgi:hypothetical protein